MDYETALRVFESATAAYCDAMRRVGAVATEHTELTGDQLQEGIATLDRCRGMLLDALNDAPGLGELVRVPPLPACSPSMDVSEPTAGKQ